MRKGVVSILSLLMTFSVYCENVISISQSQEIIPVIVGKQDNQVLTFGVTTPTSIKLQEIRLTTKGTKSLHDIESLQIYYLDKTGKIDFSRPYGMPQKPAAEVIFRESKSLAADDKLAVTVALKSQVGALTDKIYVAVAAVKANDTWIEVEDCSHLKKLRYGVCVRDAGMDGVNTYRIPGLVTAKDGSLLAIFDVRRDVRYDLQGNIDIGLVRSADSGRTWQPMQIPLDMGTWGNLPQKYNGVSDANILVDANSGRIFIFGLWMHGVLDKEGKWIRGLNEDSEAWEHQWKNKGSQPGYGVKRTCQLMMATSDDNGKTWSEPRNITRMGKRRAWWLWTCAPGNGITMQDGTLVFPSQGRDREGIPFSAITYSRDGGRNWRTSKPAYGNTTECSVVELDEGQLMLNMRFNGNRKNLSDNNGRVVAVTDDMGATWTEHETSRSSLIEPVCMASLYKHRYKGKNGESRTILLFVNPSSRKGRERLTLKMSFDNGKTWPEDRWILLDEPLSKGRYSCITSISDNIIGILYEGSQAQMTFQQIKLTKLPK